MSKLDGFCIAVTDIIKFQGKEIGYAYLLAPFDEPKCEVVVDCSMLKIHPKSFDNWKITDLNDQVLGTLKDGKTEFVTRAAGVTPRIKLVDPKGISVELERFIGDANPQ